MTADAILYAALFGVPGALIASQLPRHPVGWLMLAVGACFAGNAVALQWLASGREHGADTMSWWSDRGSAVVVPLTLLLVLLLPDGRLPSRRWRPVVVAVMGAQLTVVALWCLVPVLPVSWRPLSTASSRCSSCPSCSASPPSSSGCGRRATARPSSASWPGCWSSCCS